MFWMNAEDCTPIEALDPQRIFNRAMIDIPILGPVDLQDEDVLPAGRCQVLQFATLCFRFDSHPTAANQN